MNNGTPAFPEIQKLPALLRDLAEEIENGDNHYAEAYIARMQGREDAAQRHTVQMNRSNRHINLMKQELCRRMAL